MLTGSGYVYVSHLNIIVELMRLQEQTFRLRSLHRSCSGHLPLLEFAPTNMINSSENSMVILITLIPFLFEDFNFLSRS
jgi:hypothetical protein